MQMFKHWHVQSKVYSNRVRRHAAFKGGVCWGWETELRRICKRINDAWLEMRAGLLERKVRELEVEAIVLGVVVRVPLVKNGHVLDDGLCNSLSQLQRTSTTLQHAHDGRKALRVAAPAACWRAAA
jgi:hypothetical protein